MVNTRDGQPDSRLRPDRRDRPAEDALAGEDVVVGQITVMPPGMTGRRRLVDQVPMELAPWDAVNDRDAGADQPHSTENPERRVSRPGRPIETASVHDPTDQVMGGRDQNRRQRVVSVPSERIEPAHRTMSDDRRDLPGPASPSRQPWPWRDQIESAPQRHADSKIATHGFTSPDRVPAESLPQRQLIASRDEPMDADIRQDGTEGDLPRGLRPAPIPGPVPTQELRHGLESGSRPVETTATPSRLIQRPFLSSEGDQVRQLSRAMPPPLLEDSRSLAHGWVARTTPARRPTLPDLSDDFFTSGVISPSARSDSVQPRPSRDGFTEGSPGQAIAEPGTGADHQDPRPVRARPAVPRLGAGAAQPPSREQTIPTVAEANRLDWTPPAARPPRTTSAPQSDTGWAAPRPVAENLNRPGTQRPIQVNDVSQTDDVDREPVRLEPPIPLRPQPADFGEYGGWFDLQSVEPSLAPDLQRACATCRDFRPSENGERGWCTNRDSFTLRTVVNSSDLPCISSFGCWWVPFDDIWLSEAAIRGHRNPTPLLDQTIGPDEEFSAATRQRRRSQ